MEKQVKAWIARDRNGELYIYAEKPKLREDGTFVAESFLSSEHFKNDVNVCSARSVTITLEDNE